MYFNELFNLSNCYSFYAISIRKKNDKITNCFKKQITNMFGGSNSKESARNMADPDSIPRSERPTGGGNGNSLQYFPWKISWTEKPCRL